MSKFQDNKNKAPTIFSEAKDHQKTDIRNISQKFSPEVLEKLDKEVEKIETKKVNKKLESLIFLGRAKKEINISNFKFKMFTLTNSEQRDLISYIGKEEDSSKMFSLKLATLALAIKEINDVSFYEFIDLDEDSLDLKILFLSQLQSNLLDALFNEYSKLFKESTEMVLVDEIKN